MTHLFVHACAGSGKTKYVVDHCSQSHPKVRRLIITLMVAGQDELEGRLQMNIDPSVPAPEVTGWYVFLINHIVRPYLPLLFPQQRITGFMFDLGDERDSNPIRPKTNPRRYFSKTGLIYKDSLEELATRLIDRAGGLVEKRLSRIYDEILFDEVQDISRWGLEVIARLLRQDSVRCLLVGDTRQSLIDSSLSSKKNQKADRQNLMKWYREFEKSGRLKIVEKVETYRFNQNIAEFSDTIFPKEFGFSPTVSKMNDETSHDGVFLLAKEDLDHYIAEFAPTVLWYSKSSWSDQTALNPITFGKSKGRTYPRVLILATKSIQKFCLKGELLRDKSACGFYVAVTRARYSVAIAIDLDRTELMASAPLGREVWSPRHTSRQESLW